MAPNGNGEAAEPKKTCFIVCPIGGELSPQRKHSDQALRHILKPVLEKAGFEEPARADKISESGNINRQIINHLREDSLVIADLTGHNPNVFYELAIRHCTGLPFIQMIRKGEAIPFDLGPMRTIFFDLTDPDDVVSAREELARQVKAAMQEGAAVDTPVGAAMDFEKLRSGGSVEQMLSRVIEKVDELGRRVPGSLTNAIRRVARGESLDPTPVKKIGGFAFGEDGSLRSIESDLFAGMDLTQIRDLFEATQLRMAQERTALEKREAALRQALGDKAQ
jgi:hypothetical protein